MPYLKYKIQNYDKRCQMLQKVTHRRAMFSESQPLDLYNEPMFFILKHVVLDLVKLS